MQNSDQKICNNKQDLINFCNDNLKNIAQLKEKLNNQGKTNNKEHDENFTFFSFIKYSIDKPFWDYPLTITYNDKPDFQIGYDNKKVSLEVTRQKSKNFGHTLKLDKKYNPEYLDLGHFKYNVEKNKQYTTQELEDIICNKHPAPPSMGFDDFPLNWLDRSIDTIQSKNEKMKKYPNIGTFTNHVLLVFDLAPEPINTLADKHFVTTNFYQKCSCTLFERIIFIDGHIIDVNIENKKVNICHNNPAILIIQKHNKE